jgi:hypothetical protein
VNECEKPSSSGTKILGDTPAGVGNANAEENVLTFAGAIAIGRANDAHIRREAVEPIGVV